MLHTHMHRQSIPSSCTPSWLHRPVHSLQARSLLPSASRRFNRVWTVHASAEQTPEMRDTIKRLTKLFYFDQAAESGIRVVQHGQHSQPKPMQLGAKIKDLPLWRVEWSVLPGSQEILHVMAPHYSHMFEGVFSRPRPWLFGHLYLPGGSKHLGAAGYELSSGSRAPLVGTLAQVTRAVRLRDGKFLILATAMTRFKVCRCEQELPYSVADVELFEDVEVLEGHNQPALAAVMQAAAPDASITSLMAAGSAAAREACAAVSWAWLRGYELSVAAQQEWPGPGPREGESDLETHVMVQELMAHGVSEVLPLPDGVVIGRVNLGEVVAAAEEAQQQALQAAVQLWLQDSAAEPSVTTAAAAVIASGDDGSHVVSLNTTADRGVKFEGPEVSQLVSSSSSSMEDVLMLEAAVWAQLDTLVALASRVRGNRQTLPFGLLQLRPGAIDPHTVLYGSLGPDKSAQPGRHNTYKPSGATDAAGSDGASSGGSAADAGNAGAAAKIVDQESQQQEKQVQQQQQQHVSDMQGGRAAGSSTELDDLPVTSNSQAISDGGSTNSNSSDNSSGTAEQHLLTSSKYAFAASDGMDVHADPLWPPLRRAAKLSWAAAAVVVQMEQDNGEIRQALLEAPSIAQRLRFVSAVLSKHVKVLSAIAAVKDVEK